MSKPRRPDPHTGCKAALHKAEHLAMLTRWALGELTDARGPLLGWIREGRFRAFMVRPLSATGGGLVLQAWSKEGKRWDLPAVYELEDWCHWLTQRTPSGTGKAYEEDWELHRLACKVNQARVKIIQAETERLKGGRDDENAKA